MRFVLVVLAAVCMLALSMGAAVAKEKTTVAVIKTDKGDIVIKFLPEDAPKHVENFTKLAESGFYDGLTFHRVEPNFVIQGGDPRGNGTGGPSEADLTKAYGGKIPSWIRNDPTGYTLPAEIKAPHIDGAVAMARTNNPEKRSSTSQFYICLGPQHFLDGNYTVFGQVIEGMDVARKITRGDKMLKVTIEER
jgi:peptidyl-prolyl cis-trans isomerase B (cyclophilin B)